jgi:cytochrome c oxidase subunit II
VTIFSAGRTRVLAAGLFLAAELAAAPRAGAAAPPRPGEFDICQGCHGVNGQGNAELGAPRIAGLDARYVGRQLADFRDRRRGAGDSLGEQMITITSMLDETTIGRLSAYVGAMPEVEATRTLQGERKAGESTFTICAACHGAHAEGKAALGAPRLAGMSDWYLARQFSAFASGTRGAAAGDERNAAMRGIAESMKNEQAVRDVVAYAASLQAPAEACGNRAGGACDSSR